MSYILEALRKAEAERERGAVPDLHTQPLVMSDRDEAPERPRWLLPAGLLVVATLLLAVFAWWLVQGKDERPQVVTRVAPPAPPATAPVPITPPASPPAAATEASPTAQSVAPRSEPVAPRSEPVTPRNEPALPPRVAAPSPSAPTAAQRAEKREPAAPATRQEKRAPSAAPTPTHAAAPAASDGGRVAAISELPEDVRRQLPNFAFGGAVYSDNPANRMLIINGQLFSEGGQPAPDVVLDQIRLKSAVFRYRGHRYEMPY